MSGRSIRASAIRGATVLLPNASPLRKLLSPLNPPSVTCRPQSARRGPPTTQSPLTSHIECGILRVEIEGAMQDVTHQRPEGLKHVLGGASYSDSATPALSLVMSLVMFFYVSGSQVDR